MDIKTATLPSLSDYWQTMIIDLDSKIQIFIIEGGKKYSPREYLQKLVQEAFEEKKNTQ